MGKLTVYFKKDYQVEPYVFEDGVNFLCNAHEHFVFFSKFEAWIPWTNVIKIVEIRDKNMRPFPIHNVARRTNTTIVEDTSGFGIYHKTVFTYFHSASLHVGILLVLHTIPLLMGCYRTQTSVRPLLSFHQSLLRALPYCGCQYGHFF